MVNTPEIPRGPKHHREESMSYYTYSINPDNPHAKKLTENKTRYKSFVAARQDLESALETKYPGKWITADFGDGDIYTHKDQILGQLILGRVEKNITPEEKRQTRI